MTESLGRVTQVTPLRVQRTDDTRDALSARTGTDWAGVTVGAEVLIRSVQDLRVSTRVYR